MVHDFYIGRPSLHNPIFALFFEHMEQVMEQGEPIVKPGITGQLYLAEYMQNLLYNL